MPRSVPRRIEQVRLSISSLFVLPSPVNRRVGIRNFTFEACSSFTHVAAYQIAARLKADICPEAPDPVSYPTKPLGSYHAHRRLHGWVLPPPLAICAVAAHSQPNVHRTTETLRVSP